MESTTCSICLESVSGERGHTLECNHTFHSNCLIKWLREGGLSCPCCRNDLAQEAETHIPTLALHERAAYLRRTVARRRNAPRELLRQIANLQKVEGEERDVSRTVSQYRAENRDVLKENQRLQRRKWALQRRVRRLRRALGLYQAPGIELPALSLFRF